MKNTIIGSLFALILLFSGCKQDEWPVADIVQVPVYSLTKIVGTNAPFAIDIYKDKPILLEFASSTLVKKLNTLDYLDNSNDTNFMLTFKATEKSKSIVGTDTLLNRRYELNALKTTQLGTLKVVTYNKMDSIVTNYTIKVAEETRYN